MELSDDELLSELSPVELPSAVEEPFVDVSAAVDPEVDEPELEVEDCPVDDSAPVAPVVVCAVDEPVEPALDVAVELVCEVLASLPLVEAVLPPSELESEPSVFGLLSVVLSSSHPANVMTAVAAVEARNVLRSRVLVIVIGVCRRFERVRLQANKEPMLPVNASGMQGELRAAIAPVRILSFIKAI